MSVKRQVDRTSPIANTNAIAVDQDPLKWYAVGDSYTAGPGAGVDYDEDRKCTRNRGSYVVQLETDHPNYELDFLACSGYVAQETLEKTAPVLRQDWADFMVMTIGGNDIKFSEIAIDCLVRPGLIFHRSACADTIKRAQLAIAAPKLENDIHAVYDALFAKMKDDEDHQVYHIFYHRFFNAEDPWCDDESLNNYGYPKLTQSLRRELNDLSDQLNSRLEDIVTSYAQKQALKPSWQHGARLIGLNPDKQTRSDGSTYGLFDGHRFCEPGATKVEDDNVWLFGTLDSDALQKYDFKEFWDLPEKVTSSFHPKTAGFAAVKTMLEESLQKNRPSLVQPVETS